MKKRVRTGMLIASAILFIVELIIAIIALTFKIPVFYDLGDILLMVLLYTMWRTVFPDKPKYSALIPTAILLFASGIEVLQFWDFCDRMHITNEFLRLCIGTGKSVSDFFCYIAGVMPCYITEFLLHTKADKEEMTWDQRTKSTSSSV
ncbi:MAG: DUF2809 domain-containing protein [Ruminococcus sp.]|nr:DUF2809 domain-containing protein [Ruminococcus sp.]